jgi:hypothetical protein
MKGTNVPDEAFSDTSSASIATYSHQDTVLKLTVKEGGKHDQASQHLSCSENKCMLLLSDEFRYFKLFGLLCDL